LDQPKYKIKESSYIKIIAYPQIHSSDESKYEGKELSDVKITTHL
jgi:hypothetical protein